MKLNVYVSYSNQDLNCGRHIITSYNAACVEGDSGMKKLTILLIVIMIIGLVGTEPIMLGFNEEFSTNETSKESKFVSTDLDPHDNIVIFGNDEFTSTALVESWTGNGSESGPYIIEGYEFSTTDVCLSITNTSSHFIIRNCSFTRIVGDNLNIGIELANLTNGVVTNCSFVDIAYGVLIKFSENCTLVNSTYTGSRWFAVNAWLCEDLEIEDNIVIGGLLGINLSESTGLCSIKGNVFINSTPSFSGEEIAHWIHDLADNTVNGLPIAYFYNLTDTTVDLSGYGAAIIFNCSEIVVKNGYFVNSTVRLAFVSNCTITDFVGKAHRLMVSFYYATNCTLQNSVFDRNFNAFSIGSTCTNCTVRNNTIYNTVASAGIRIHGANGTRVINNTLIGLENSNTDGIELGGEFCVVENNTISKHGNGTFMTHSYFCNVSNNVFNNNTGSGCRIYYMRNSTVSNNTLTHNFHGVSLYKSHDCQVVDNNIYSNQNDGITSYESEDCFIRNNTITNNEGYGVFLWGDSNGFEIYDNTIGWNVQGNALDDGSSNTWDNGVDRGNRWSDYIPPHYLISGSAGSVDRYPSVIVDIYPPNLIVNHAPMFPIPDQNVTISAEIFESSILVEVILSYSTDSGLVWHNITMVYNNSDWIAEIPGFQNNTQVTYRVYAEDVHGNWAWSLIKLYDVQEVVITSTTTTTATTTTTSSTTSTTNTTNGTLIGPLTLEIILICGVGGVVVILIIVLIKRR